MKIFKLLVLALMALSFSANLYADGDPSKPFGDIDYKIDWKLKSDTKKAREEFSYRTGKPVDFYVDFQLGVGATNPNITTKGTGAIEEETELGYVVGGLIYFNVFEMFSFTTGVTFDGKSFGFQKPYSQPLDATADTMTTGGYVPANYFVIPLFIDYGGMITEDFGLRINGGPYFGFLMSQPENTYQNLGYKNFDLGLSASLTGNYVFMYPFSRK
ncbi:MAG: hypothetical protein MUE56_06150 [Ignavibacteria bacterium]|nr:hypothetical protein [Ignavibacteria bacterium]